MSSTKFETETCGRCGGSGQHSYCQMHGSTCFGCNGKGIRLTKRGSAARAFWIASRTVRADSVKVGDRVRCMGVEMTLRAIEASGSYSSSKDAEGNEVRRYYTNLCGQKSNCGVFPETEVELIPTTVEAKNAALRAAFAYQDTLGKNGKPLSARALAKQTEAA